MHGAAGKRGGTGRVGADAVFDEVGLTVDDADTLVIDAERLGGNLRHGGLKALAERSTTGNQFYGAAAVDENLGVVSRPLAAFLEEERNTGADSFAGCAAFLEIVLQLVPAEGDKCLVEQSGIVAGIDFHLFDAGFAVFDHVRHLGRADEIAPAHLDRIDPEPGGDGVHQPAAHERAFESARGAVGGARRLVGQPHARQCLIGRYLVAAGEHVHGAVRHVDAMGADIGALVVQNLILDSEDETVVVDRDAGKMALLAPLIGAHQMLAPVLNPFHRPAKPHGGDQYQHVLRIEFAADAETAADMAFVHVQRRWAAFEHAAQGFAIAMGNFCSAVQLQEVTRGVVAADGATGLQRHAGVPPGLQVELDHGVRLAEGSFDVAVTMVQHDGFAAAARLEFTGRIAGGYDDR